MPKRRRRLPGLDARRFHRAAAHLAVIGLVAACAGLGFSQIHPASTSREGLAFNLITAVRGAAGRADDLRSAQFDLQPNPENADPLLSRRVLPTATPAPTPVPTQAPTPAPVATSAPVVAARVVGTGKLLWPVPGGVITQYFWSGHLALDIAAHAGSAVLAADAGTVVFAGWRDNGGGLVIEVDHGNGLHTGYNHLGVINVGVGQVVGRGQRIASVGCTGLCTGPHVHFQVIVHGVLVNPLRYL